MSSRTTTAIGKRRAARGDGMLWELALLASDRYQATSNYAVLHLVTSCHALRLLLPLVRVWRYGGNASSSFSRPMRPASTQAASL